MMRRTPRLTAAVVLIAFSTVLGGCASGGNWDPSDLLDFLDTKKKLPGKREAVFPDGVPGLEQGVPKELYKGAQEQQNQQQSADAAAAPAAQQPEPPKADDSKSAKSKKAKPKIVRKRITAPPPDQTAQPAQSTDATPQQPAASFPAPMPSGSFTH